MSAIKLPTLAQHLATALDVPASVYVQGTPEWDLAHDFSERKPDDYAFQIFRRAMAVVERMREVHPDVEADAIERVVRFKALPNESGYRRFYTAVLVELSRADEATHLVVFEAESPDKKKKEVATRKPRGPEIIRRR